MAFYSNFVRGMLERMMSRRWLELDYKVLAHAINHTIMFENLLCKRFPAKPGFNFEKVCLVIYIYSVRMKRTTQNLRK